MKAQTTMLIAVLVCCSCMSHREDPVILEDFDGQDYGNWEKQGTAFGDGPTVELLGHHSRAHASSVHPGGEPATGTLTSPPFPIERSFIHFLLGGREKDFLGMGTSDPPLLCVQLLVEGKVVRQAAPEEFHALFHRGWDVSDLNGKEARFRIVDMDEREGAFIDVDHIVMNNIPVEGIVEEKPLHVEKQMLILPVKQGAFRQYVELYEGDRLVRAFDVELAGEETDYWVALDLEPWTGRRLVLRTRQYFSQDPELLEKVVQADSIPGEEDMYREALRPQFHFSARRGWINDPNGLVFFDGEYHLYYQANPYGWDHSRNDYNKTWGHAVSSDLVHWRELPAAIHPDHLGSIYSGSAVVDHLNTTGFQSGSEPPIVAVYTSAGSRNRWSLGRKFTQSLAYSNDRGRTFTPYPGNPVQENLGYINRDPKAFWYAPGGHWVLVLYLDHGAFAFFSSKDLLTWERQSTLEIGELDISEVAAFEDCPELFPLPLNGDPEDTRWVMYAGSGDYVLGSFDGSTFSPTSGLLPYNHGDCFYASQTFNNTGPEDGRRIQMAWGTVDFPGMPFNQMMNFPVELSLQRTENGIRMHANPVEEIESLYLDTRTWEKVELLPGQVFQPADKAGLYDLQMEIYAGSTSLVQMTLNGREISYDAKKHRLYSEEQEATLSPLDGSIHLRILVDRMSVEIFGNRGQVYMPLQTGPGGIGKAMEFTCEKGSAKLTGLSMHKLKTIWLP